MREQFRAITEQFETFILEVNFEQRRGKAAAMTRAALFTLSKVFHVAVKVRTASFYTRSKIAKLPEPTTDPAEVVRMARVVLGT